MFVQGEWVCNVDRCSLGEVSPEEDEPGSQESSTDETRTVVSHTRDDAPTDSDQLRI